MKRILFILPVLLLLSFSVFAQEDDDVDRRPVRTPFGSSLLMNSQTIVNQRTKGLQFDIQHRFGVVKNGYDDFYGLFAPSNIRLGLNYGITDKIALGWGLTKGQMIQDFNAKVALLQQTRSGSMPIFLTYYGNISLDTRTKATFDKFSHRVSYFNEIIVGRKINRLISVEVAFAHSHFNLADTATYKGLKHDNFSANFNGKVRITPSMSILFEYNYQITGSEMSVQKSNLGLGVEFGTATHSFQLFASTFDALSYQRDMVYGAKDFSKGEFLLGFNISKRY